MRSLVLVVFLMLSVTAGAADRKEKIHALMEAQGLVQMFESQMASGKEYGRQQSAQIMDQLMTGLSPNAEFEARFRKASDSFIKAVETPWTAQDIVDVWARFYGESFTDQELDQLVAFYTSPLGKKDVQASQKALPAFTSHFVELSKPILEKATQKYIQDLQVIVKECNCQKT